MRSSSFALSREQVEASKLKEQERVAAVLSLAGPAQRSRKYQNGDGQAAALDVGFRPSKKGVALDARTLTSRMTLNGLDER